jgi:hypothetical protein
MISDKDAVALAQALHREACLRMKVKPRETVGEIAFVSGAKVAVLFDSNGKMAGAYRVSGESVVDLDGPELTKPVEIIEPRSAVRRWRRSQSQTGSKP